MAYHPPPATSLLSASCALLFACLTGYAQGDSVSFGAKVTYGSYIHVGKTGRFLSKDEPNCLCTGPLSVHKKSLPPKRVFLPMPMPQSAFSNVPANHTKYLLTRPDIFVEHVVPRAPEDFKNFNSYKTYKSFEPQQELKTNHLAFAIGNNLLYDALLLPNLSLEAALLPHYSLRLQGAWTWLSTEAPDYWRYRIQLLWLENRYWFGNAQKPLEGFFSGIYGAAGTYDIRVLHNGKEPIGSLSNFSYSLGMTSGYSVPLDDRWKMEFSAGVGYMAGEYYNYNWSACENCAVKRSTKQSRYFGPTQAAVSLIYTITNNE